MRSFDGVHKREIRNARGNFGMLMQRYWRTALAFFAGMVLVAVIAWASGVLPTSAPYCYADESGHKDCATYNIALIALWAMGKVLNSISSALTAIATLVIAAFTATLWIATSRQAELTARSVRVSEQALTDLERPYLFVLDYNWLLKEKAEAKGIKHGLVYSVMNGGKLPAFIKNVKIGMRFGQSIPPMEDIPPIHELLTAPLIGGGEKREIVQELGDENGEAAHECRIRDGIAIIPASAFRFDRVIVKISIDYDGPITTGHMTTACWEWHPVKYAFTQYGGAEHNQRT